MAPRIQRLLAVIDRFVHEFFRMERSETRGLYIYKHYYWGRLGRRCAIVDKDGHVTHLGYSWSVRHHHDEKGVLLSRLSMKHWAGPEDKVIYDRAAELAWLHDPRSYFSLTGGTEKM